MMGVSLMVRGRYRVSSRPQTGSPAFTICTEDNDKMSRKFAFLALLVVLLAGFAVPLHAQDTPPAADLITVEVGVYVVGASMFDLATAMYSVDFYVTMHCDKPCTDEDIAFDVVGLGSAEGYNVEV